MIIDTEKHKKHAPSVTVIMPWRDQGDLDRRASMQWLVGWYERKFPDWNIMLADSPADELWSKPMAINNAAEMAPSDVIIVTDTDVVPDQDVLRTAARHALTAPWVIPHGLVHRLRPEPTERLLSAYGVSIPLGPLVRSPYRGIPGGGLFVIRTERFLATGGFDPAFKGWGGEDSAWGVCADTLIGSHLRYPHVNLLHMYHAPGLREVNPHYSENVRRVVQYRQAQDDRVKMAHFRGVPLPELDKVHMHMPQRTDTCEEWLLYLNHIGVEVPRMASSQKLALIALAIQNEPGVNRW